MATGAYGRSRWLRDAELEAMEGIDFGALARSLGPVQKQVSGALPGVVQGATAGAAAGPWGALIGGLAGGALSAATKRSSKKPSAPVPTTPGPSPAPTEPTPTPTSEPIATGQPAAPAPPVAAPVATSPGAAQTAAGQLVQLLENPALRQTLGALASGQRRDPGGLPFGAILNLLGTLANNAAYEAEAIQGETDDSYLRGADGRFLLDPSAPAERAALVWDRLFHGNTPVVSSSTWEGEADAADWLVESGIAERL